MWSDLTFGPPLHSQMRVAKLKSAYNLFTIGPIGLLMLSDLTFGPLLQGQTRLAKHKNP